MRTAAAEIAGGDVRRQTRLHGRAGSLGLVLPAIALVGALVIFPLVRLAASSFEGGFSNYSELASSKLFRLNLRTTFEVAFLVTFICLLLGYPVAYLLVHLRQRPARVILLVVLLTFWISILVRTYAWTALLGRTGLINDALVGVGLRDQPADLLYSRFAVIVGMTHYLLPFMILTLYAGFRGIDQQLARAARTLGASGWQTFRRIFLPLSRPSIFAGFVLIFVLSLGFFITPVLLGGPEDATIAVFIHRRATFLDFGGAAAASMVLLVLTFLVILIAGRFLGVDRLLAAVTGQRS